ncbi:hypothetical protein NIES4072_66290 [Nostoc commune NIES-4072]|uniref:Uncharacterized protein n=1 Tax=Nostoc commune NIES-4072 TaxID=2005467 RepID=A0A2R5FW11_NOSCO|nr:hypothetical protein [Nostoc commune]BBD70263.1 hypothetical protein NIES4070_66740 [Nostoc commune HK-02]GBG22917.1 hypothetical protein NIES4072_66290 [Nostoc commune NIES-4072]
MDIQSTLTQAIEVIVMSFVALMIFDFVDGLYVVPLPPITIAQSSANRESTVTATPFEPLSTSEQLVVEPQQIPFVASQFEEVSDPWTLELEPHNSSTETQPVVLQFPSLRLLPPATKVQPKSKAKTAKTTKLKSTKTTKTQTTKGTKQSLTKPTVTEEKSKSGTSKKAA